MSKRTFAALKIGTPAWSSFPRDRKLRQWNNPITATDADAVALITAMSVRPLPARQTLIENLITGLKTDGVWSKLDCLQVYAAHAQQAARVDWKLPSRVATAVNSPTFTVDRGFTTDGATNYIDSNFNISTSSLYVRDSASYGGYRRTPTGTPNGFIGATGITREVDFGVSSTLFAARINMTAAYLTFTQSPSAGFYAANRSGASAVELYKDGASVATGTTASVAITSTNLQMGRVGNTVFTAAETAMMFAGSSLTATDHANFNTRFQTFRAGVGF